MAGSAKPGGDNGMGWSRMLCVAVAGLALAGCTSLWPGSSAAERPATAAAESAYASGANAFAAGHFGLAAQAFHDAVEEAPNSVEALNGLAATYDHVGRYDLAARYYGRALTLDPSSAQTLNNIGYSHMLQGKFDLAAVFLRDAQARAPNDPAIAANRAIAEAALRASQPRPSARWSLPPEIDSGRLPRVRIERTTPLVQTLVARTASFNRSMPPAGGDSLPEMLKAPMGDTRMAAAADRLPRPMAAAMGDASVAAPQAPASGGEYHDSAD